MLRCGQTEIRMRSDHGSFKIFDHKGNIVGLSIKLDVQVNSMFKFFLPILRELGQGCVIGVIDQSRGEPQTSPIMPITQT